MPAHPLYLKKRRRLYVVACFAVAIGVLGLALPIIPGIALVLFGLTLLKTQSLFVQKWLARVHARYPKISDELDRIERWIENVFDLTTHTRSHQDIPIRRNRTVSALVEVSHILDGGVAVVLHGASGTKEMRLMSTLAESMRASGHTVIRFDAYDGIGESAGTFASFTTTKYHEDLTDVILWARKQAWWREPLILVGHSLGGMVACLYAKEHLAEVAELILFAPTISGASLCAAYTRNDPDLLATWEREGIRTVRHPLTGETFGLGFAFIEDVRQYDIIPYTPLFTQPVRIVSGSVDIMSPPEECRQFAALLTHGTYTELPDLPHTPTNWKHLRALFRALS